MVKFKPHTAALAFAVAVTTLTSPAAASDDSASIIVTTHDLNLTSAAGQRTLAGRINRAARSVCDNGGRDLTAIRAENACIAAARADAMAQAGAVTTAALTVRARRS